jgi:hypothetical protein
MTYSNFVNGVSTLNLPTQVNTNQTVPLTGLDTKDWKIDSKTGGLRCKNPGSWNFIAQYQICNINKVKDDADATIDGWYIINGQTVAGSDATQTSGSLNNKSVLTISFTEKFKYNDLLEFGIRSSSTNNILNCEICNATASSGVGCPSLILTGSKVKCGC